MRDRDALADEEVYCRLIGHPEGGTRVELEEGTDGPDHFPRQPIPTKVRKTRNGLRNSLPPMYTGEVMKNWLFDSAIPWPRIYALLEDCGPSDHSMDFLARALRGVERIIPFDVGCGFTETTGRYFASYGPSQKTVDDYNAYYRHRLDFLPQSMSEASVEGSFDALLPVFWRRFGATEFVGDFCKSINLGQTLTYFLPGWTLSLTLHRKGGTMAFSDADKHTLRALNTLINQRLKLIERAEKAEGGASSLGDLRARFPCLSPREAEVAAMTASGMTAQAIADEANRSRRTIESQLQSVYCKLGVPDKKALLAALSSSQGPVWIREVFFPVKTRSAKYAGAPLDGACPQT
jgi:DNA-binding CsgD family transcriptional regulator